MKTKIAAGALSLALVAGAAQAQPRGSASGWFADADAAALYQGDASLEDRPGSFGLTRVYAAPGLGYLFSPRNRASLSLGVGQKDYDFTDGAALGGGEPWNRIREVSLSAPIFFAPAERVQAIAIPSLRWNAESGASLADGRTEGILAGASYRFSDDLSVGPGFGWFSKLGGGGTAFPILLIDWDITDKFKLSTGRGLAASQGPGLTLSYAVTEQFQIGLTGRYESVRFRLDNPVAAPDGIGEDESFPLLATIRYATSRRFSVTAFAGAEMGGQLTLRDTGGTTLDEADYETAPVFGITMRAIF